MKYFLVLISMLSCTLGMIIIQLFYNNTIQFIGSDQSRKCLRKESNLPENFIVGGYDAVRHQFPYQVSIQRRITGAYQHHCGGSVLNERWIVAAGHCWTDLGDFRVIAGMLDQEELHDDVQASDVEEVIVHENYTG
jgi:secreted trypsin-like serine protease